MPEPTPRRRWFRFSLRTLFVVVTLCAIAAAGWRHEQRRYDQELAAASEINDIGVSFERHDRLPASIRRLVGEERLVMFQTIERVSFPPDGVHVDMGGGGSAMLLGVDDEQLAKLRPALAQLPNLTSLNLSDTRITDEGLTQLRGLKRLRRLNVSGTKVTRQGVASLEESLPNLSVEY